MEYLIIIIISFLIGWYLAYKDTTSREIKLEKEYELKEKEFNDYKNKILKEIQEKENNLNKLQQNWLKEHDRLLFELKEFYHNLEEGFLKGRNWLAKAFREFIETRDYELECSLVIKPNPAWKAAETVKALREKRAEMAQKLKFLEYQIETYEEYFPFLADYREIILDEYIDLREDAEETLVQIDPALSLDYISKEEYEKLSNVEKYQLALERYWIRNKSKVEIGRLYERYIGYLYEKEGWIVKYQGVLKGFEDFGRDLICKKDNITEIVQCKCWSKDKVVREKHIMQLYGTCILYKITENESMVKPVFITTTNLSNEASLVAKELRVDVRYIPLKRYPMIKCNINPGTGEKIYHLPFDQQYDKIIIGNQPGEFYANTVEEAEKAGFRRAYRWREINKE